MTAENALAIRQRFANDPHRPRYHFLPPSNWMNDPNGLIQWQGKYHIFYQYNPDGAYWGNMHWGHAVSEDLIHWTDLPVAMAPTPGGPDETGCFSGCAVDNGVPTFIYTGTRGTSGIRNDIQTQCVATSDDNLLTWKKYPGNPVIGEVPPEARQTVDFRDPFVWKQGDFWYMVVASRIQDVGGVCFTYRSKDLLTWEFLGPLLSGDQARNGVIWECPNLFKLDDAWVLIISAHAGTSTGDVRYFIGDYVNNRFIPEYEGIFDHGTMYAPLSFLDDQGRRILFGWVRESRPVEEQKSAGWSGAQSVPRVLKLNSRRRLVMLPVPELEAIRGKHHHFGPADVAHGTVPGVSGNALDIVAEFNPVGTCGLQVACSPDGTERTEITYEASTRRLTVRNISPAFANPGPAHLRVMDHDLAQEETLKLRILLDGSVIEIIANDQTSITSRFYPAHVSSTGIQIVGSAESLRSLNIWEMPSIW